MSETRSMPTQELDLFGEMRNDLKRIDGTLNKINNHFEFWLPKWEQQTHGMMTLENQQAGLKNHFERHKDEIKAEVDKLRAEIANEKTSEQKLEDMRKEAKKERQDTFRWVVGFTITVGGFTIALIAFLIQHISFR